MEHLIFRIADHDWYRLISDGRYAHRVKEGEDQYFEISAGIKPIDNDTVQLNYMDMQFNIHRDNELKDKFEALEEENELLKKKLKAIENYLKT